MCAAKESDLLELLSAHKGMVIIREGEKGNCAYLVQSGRVRVTVSKQGKQVELAQMGAGEIFGEMSLIKDSMRNATVEAMIDSNLIVLTRGFIDQKLAKSDPTIRALLPMLMKRLEQTNSALLNKGETMDNLIDVNKAIYQKIEQSLPLTQKKTLANVVKPKLDEFLGAVAAFQDRYKDNITE